MIMTDHATMRLKERYLKHDLDIPFALEVINSLPASDYNFKLVIIDDIPVLLATTGIRVDTVYPHPFDSARDYKGLMQQIYRMARNKKDQDDYIFKLQKKIDKQEKKIRSYWK